VLRLTWGCQTHFLELVASFSCIFLLFLSLFLKEVHDERLRSELFNVQLFFSGGRLVERDLCVLTCISVEQPKFVGESVRSDVDVDLVHDTPDLAGYQSVVHDCEEGLHGHGVASVHLLSVHVPAVVDGDGVCEGGEVHLFGACSREMLLTDHTLILWGMSCSDSLRIISVSLT